MRRSTWLGYDAATEQSDSNRALVRIGCCGKYMHSSASLADGCDTKRERTSVREQAGKRNNVSPVRLASRPICHRK